MAKNIDKKQLITKKIIFKIFKKEELTFQSIGLLTNIDYGIIIDILTDCPIKGRFNETIYRKIIELSKILQSDKPSMIIEE